MPVNIAASLGTPWLRGARDAVTRGGGTMSVAMTNCGAAGWISDRRGYRYASVDPLTGLRWPSMPAVMP